MKAAVLFLAGMLVLPPVVVGSDFAVLSIVTPPDTVRQNSSWVPVVALHADSANPDTQLVKARLRIGASYSQRAQATLAPGENRLLQFPSTAQWHADSLGTVTARCSLLTSDSNPANDTVSKVVTVLAQRRDFAATVMVLPSMVRRGDSMVPTAIIHADDSNPGPETVGARLRIGSSYVDSVSTILLPGASVTYLFKSWHGDTLGTFLVRCSLLVQDSVPANDTLNRSMTVLERLVDFGAEAMGTLPPVVHINDAVTPVVTVHALDGNPQPESVTAKVWIGASLTDTARTLVPPGAHVTYQFKQWQAESVGTFQYRCSLMVHDSFPFNDTNRIPITVYPQGSDFSVVSITSPPDTVLLDSEAVPTALVHAAEANQSESVSVRMRIGSTYDDTVDTVIPAGGAINVTFPSWQAQPLGTTTARCTLLTPDNDSTNDAASKQVRVVQPGGQPLEWTRTFGGDKPAAGYAVARTADGGYVAAGRRDSGLISGAYVVKTDSDGTLQWERFFAQGGVGTISSVQEVVGGGYAAASLLGSGAGLLRLDTAGNELWRSSFFSRDSFITHARSMQQVGDGTYVMAGVLEPGPMGDVGATAGYYVVRVNPDGTRRWRTVIPADVDETTPVAVRRTNDDCYVLCSGDGGLGLRLVKTDSGGTVLWSRTYQNVKLGDGRDLWCTSDGGYAVVGGAVEDTNSFRLDMYLAKVDSLGNLTWYRKYDNSSGSERADCVVQAADQGYFLGGFTWTGDQGGDQAWAVRTDSVGSILWSSIFGAGGGTEANGAVQSADGGYVIVGEGFGDAAGARLFLRKLRADHPMYH